MGELERLRAIVLALASIDPMHTDADGWEFCGVCGSQREYGAAMQHEDDCPYLAALLYRQERQEAED